MSFESPDMAKDFPGLYSHQGVGEHHVFEDCERPHKKKDAVAATRRRDSRPERRGKGYRMFEEEDSEEELVADDNTRSPSKMKKHSKPSFKFPKREKLYKIKDKDKDRDGHTPHRRDRGDKWTGDRGDHKDGGSGGSGSGGGGGGKKKEDKLKWRKKKLLTTNSNNIGKSDKSEGKDAKQVFGVPLATSVERSKCNDGISLAIVVRECIDFVEEFGLLCEGIYRISGVKSKVHMLKDAYNRGKPVFLHEHEPNIVASLLKLYLRELPEPVLTKELMPKFEEASTHKNVKQKVELFQTLIEQLPVANKTLLSWMIVHMTHVISKEKQNKMSLQNVSIVLSPTMQISHRVLNVLFTYARILFKDIILRRYVPSLAPVASRWSLDLPESPSALEEELRRQEALLARLHEDVQRGTADAAQEEQLWEVQRVVTQLKRKIKTMKKSSGLASVSEKDLPQVGVEKQRYPQASPQTNKAVKDDKNTSLDSSSDEVNLRLNFNMKQVDKSDVTDSVEDSSTKPASDTQPESDRTEQVAKEEVEEVETPINDDAPAKLEETAPPKVSEEPPPPSPTPPPEEKAAPPDPVTDDQESNVVEKSEEKVINEINQNSINNIAHTNHHVEHISESVDHRPTVTDIDTVEVIADEKQDDAKEATPEVESPVPSSDTLEMELDQQDQEDHKFVEPLPHDDDDEDDDHSRSTPEVHLPEPTGPPPPLNMSTVVGQAEKEHQFQVRFSSSSEEAVPRTGVTEAEVHTNVPTFTDSSDEASSVSSAADVEASALTEPDLEIVEDYDALLHRHNELLLEEEELLAMGDELRQKMDTERGEMERLDQEIAEIRSLGEDYYDSSDASSSEGPGAWDSDDDDLVDDPAELRDVLRDMEAQNSRLQVENNDLSSKVQQERQICLNVKVQIRMIQQRQLESSGGNLLMEGIAESDALIQSLL